VPLDVMDLTCRAFVLQCGTDGEPATSWRGKSTKKALLEAVSELRLSSTSLLAYCAGTRICWTLLTWYVLTPRLRA